MFSYMGAPFVALGLRGSGARPQLRPARAETVQGNCRLPPDVGHPRRERAGDLASRDLHSGLSLFGWTGPPVERRGSVAGSASRWKIHESRGGLSTELSGQGHAHNVRRDAAQRLRSCWRRFRPGSSRQRHVALQTQQSWVRMPQSKPVSGCQGRQGSSRQEAEQAQEDT